MWLKLGELLLIFKRFELQVYFDIACLVAQSEYKKIKVVICVFSILLKDLFLTFDPGSSLLLVNNLGKGQSHKSASVLKALDYCLQMKVSNCCSQMKVSNYYLHV